MGICKYVPRTSHNVCKIPREKGLDLNWWYHKLLFEILITTNQIHCSALGETQKNEEYTLMCVIVVSAKMRARARMELHTSLKTAESGSW